MMKVLLSFWKYTLMFNLFYFITWHKSKLQVNLCPNILCIANCFFVLIYTVSY